jgi:hypothetical protein
MKHLWTVVASAMALILSGSGQTRPFNDPRSEKNDAIDQAASNEPRDQACYTRALVSTGAAMPRNERTLAVRWTGYSNFELAYGGHILLLDVGAQADEAIRDRDWAQLQVRSERRSVLCDRLRRSRTDALGWLSVLRLGPITILTL